MIAKHTKGPFSISSVPGDGHIMASPPTHPRSRVTVAIVPGWLGIDPEEYEANKRLFRAAPDLLQKLKEVVAASLLHSVAREQIVKEAEALIRQVDED